MGFKKEVMDQLTKIEVQLGVNNTILAEHHKRSLMLEERITPLEHSHIFTTKLLKGLVSLLAAVAAISTALNYILRR